MKYVLLISVLAFSLFSYSQDSTPHSAAATKDTASHKAIEEMPEFPGGEEVLMRFIGQTVQYPEHARENNIQGRVIVGFVINEDGSLSDISIKKGVAEDIDAEALRVVKLLPRFKPGRLNGEPVKVAFVLPISFRLAADEPKKKKKKNT